MVKYRVTDRVSNVVDGFANTKKLFDNKFRDKDNDYSGVYFNQNLPDAELKNWWKSAMDDCEKCEDWKNWENWKLGFESELQKELREKLQGSIL